MLAGLIEIREQADAVSVTASGRWTVTAAAALEQALAPLDRTRAQKVDFDLSGLEAIDTAGALLLSRAVSHMAEAGASVRLLNIAERHRALLDQVARHRHAPPPPDRPRSVLRFVIEEIGEGTVDFLRQGRDFIGFVGLTIESMVRSLLNPRRIRFTSVVFHIEEVGFNALPIVGLLSFLIGVVMAYQGAEQLRQFGAEIFVVNLIAVSVLRELGVLLTAIIVAGRSGSAFTAQIGSMKIREEVDAMRALGLDPMDALVLPRIFALVVSLPILAFFANIMGLVGGALMSWAVLDISPALFIDRLHQTNVWHYLTGMIKSPFFALIIGMVGCHQGMLVSGSAESVGNRTTRAVVEAIFLVILTDAAFSIFFNLVRV